MTTSQDAVHRLAWEERQKAPVMEDPTVATPGTVDEVKDAVRAGFEAELEARFSPATTRAEAQTDSAHNPTASTPTVGADGEEQDPVGGVATEHVDVAEGDEEPRFADAPYDAEEDDREVVEAGADSAYDDVTTTNDIKLDAPDDVDVDEEGSTPVDDTDRVAEANEEANESGEWSSGDALYEYESGASEDDDLEGLTRAELLDRAADKEVAGRSSMNKEELVRALRQ